MLEPVRALLQALPGYLPLMGMVEQRSPCRPWPEDHWGRRVMDRVTRGLIAGLEPQRLRALEISGDAWSAEPFKSYCSLCYPTFDICTTVLDEGFDLIIAEQVFEHLLRPQRAGRNVYAMLNPGGYFLLTTPFLVRIHNDNGYPDCTRWTETGLRYFLAECGFELRDIHTGSWGNRACVRANFSHWARYWPVIHSLRNEPEFPFVAWALAQKER